MIGKSLAMLVACAVMAQAASPYVRPAKPDRAQAGKGSKAKLRLHVRDKTLGPQAKEIWLRVELENTSAKPIRYLEQKSFFKTCGLSDLIEIQFADAGGKPVPEFRGCATGKIPEVTRWPAGTSEEQKQRMVGELYRLRSNKIDVELRPGETLISRPRHIPSGTEAVRLLTAGEDPYGPLPGDFCRFEIEPLNLAPGRYRLKAVLRNPPLEMEEIRSMGLDGKAADDMHKWAKAQSLGVLESAPVTLVVK